MAVAEHIAPKLGRPCSFAIGMHQILVQTDEASIKG